MSEKSEKNKLPESIRQLVNTNYKGEEIKVNYDTCVSNTEKSLLIVNKY